MNEQKRLSQNEKERIANRINYFRTLPYSVRKMAGDLEAAGRVLMDQVVDHEIKSVLVGGRVMILNCS